MLLVLLPLLTLSLLQFTLGEMTNEQGLRLQTYRWEPAQGEICGAVQVPTYIYIRIAPATCL